MSGDGGRGEAQGEGQGDSPLSREPDFIPGP